MKRIFAPLLALGLMISISGSSFGQSTGAPIDQGYILLNGVHFVVRGNVAYAVTGDITQYITPAAAQTLREGYMLLPNGTLTPAPSSVSYSNDAPPQSTVEAERLNATRPVSGENLSGLAPNTNTTRIAGNGTTAASNLNTNASTSTSGNGTASSAASANGQVVTPGVNGGAINPVRTTGTNGGVVVPGNGQIQTNQTLNQAQAPMQNQTAVNPVRQNATQSGAQVLTGTQSNGTRPAPANGVQPNGSAAPTGGAGGASGAR